VQWVTILNISGLYSHTQNPEDNDNYVPAVTTKSHVAPECLLQTHSAFSKQGLCYCKIGLCVKCGFRGAGCEEVPMCKVSGKVRGRAVLFAVAKLFVSQVSRSVTRREVPMLDSICGSPCNCMSEDDLSAGKLI